MKCNQKTLAICDNYAIKSRSVITKLFQKTMAIGRIAGCVFYDRGRIAMHDRSRIAIGCSEIGLHFFLYLCCLWSDFQTVFSKMIAIHTCICPLYHLTLKYIFNFHHSIYDSLSPTFLKPIPLLYM